VSQAAQAEGVYTLSLGPAETDMGELSSRARRDTISSKRTIGIVPTAARPKWGFRLP
jgi:hypothetical protein